MSKNYVNPCKVITGVNTRWSYANVWEPKSINGGTPKYSVSLIIPKSDTKTIEKIRAAIKAAYDEGQGKLKGNGRAVPALEAIKFRSVTAIWNVLVMTLIKTVSLLMPTLPLSRALSMLTASISWNALKSTLASMAVHPSISMLSTAMATKVLPAASTTCRRFVTANPSVANLVLKMTSLRLTMTIFWHKE